ncbi:MAG: type II CRISPR RNA-guided endonuclease Cas9, partial [Lachnospirales bacterium]
FHHAKDAYLNIVVGNVYNTKFTSNPMNFFKVQNNNKRSYNLKRMYEFNVERKGYIAWDTSKENNSLEIVKRSMGKNDILFTRMSKELKGKFFDQNIMPKGKGQHTIKTKESPLSDINKYGGYNNVSGAYFMLVKHFDKKGVVKKTLEHVPVYLVKSIEKDESALVNYVLDLGYIEPEILIKKIKINSLININGGLFHISSRTGVQINLKPAMQLIVDDKTYKYVKKLVKVVDKINEYAKNKGTEIYKVNSYDEVEKEENLKVYDLYIDKLENTTLGKRPNSILEKLVNKKELFESLDIENQCIVLVEILKFFECSARVCNLKLIGESKDSGKTLVNKDLAMLEKAMLIHKSVTGFYMSKVDIKSL